MLKISRVKPGRVKRSSKSHGSGRVGSGRIGRFSDLMGRAGSRCPDLTHDKPWVTRADTYQRYIASTTVARGFVGVLHL